MKRSRLSYDEWKCIKSKAMKEETEALNYKEQAGIKKKSFELNYNGGSIWCEHLYSMGDMEAEVIKKHVSEKE